jgi:DNA-binding NarL/FixJ family response regulator
MRGTTDTARVLVCAEDESIRVRIEAVLEASKHELVATVESPDELVSAATFANAEVVVVAHEFEPFTPVADIDSLEGQLDGACVVVVACGFVGSGVRRALRSGIEGIVLESDVERALVATVDAVLTDRLCIPSSLRSEIARPVFSHREKQVLELVMRGMTNGEIASQLYLSESTVKSHLASSFRKLGVSSRTEAVQRMLDPDSGFEPAAAGDPELLANGRN